MCLKNKPRLKEKCLLTIQQYLISAGVYLTTFLELVLTTGDDVDDVSSNKGPSNKVRSKSFRLK